jgi:soluble lytic murein transglycosylase-like protein
VRRVGFVALLAAAAAAGVATWVVTAEPEWYERIRYPLRYEAIVQAHARNYDLPPTLLAAVIYTESKFDASARSQAGAVGLMQLLPDTAKGIAIRKQPETFPWAREFHVEDPDGNVIRFGSDPHGPYEDTP